MTIKNLFGTLIGVVIGGEAIRQVGKIGGIPSGLKSVTQIGIGLGVLGNTLKSSKSIFKFK